MVSVFSVQSLASTLVFKIDNQSVVTFNDGICKIANNQTDAASFPDCLLWASHEVSETFRIQVLEGLIQLSPEFEVFSILFSPELFSLIVHCIGVLLIALILHLFYSVIPKGG